MGWRACANGMRKAMLFMFLAMAGFAYADESYYWADFEGDGETKTSYGAGTVVLSGIEWELTEALIGLLDQDWKHGLRAARLRDVDGAAMTMLADFGNGISALRFKYCRFGGDAQSEWLVESSGNQGETWQPLGAPFTVLASNEPQTFALANLDLAGSVRIRIRPASSSGSNGRRLNIDDIVVVPLAPEPCRPLVQTVSAMATGSATALAVGDLLYDGGSVVANRGFVYNTTGMPDLDDATLYANESGADFRGELTGLVAGGRYYLRAFAVNGQGVRYGPQVVFETPPFDAGPDLLPTEAIDRDGFTIRWQPLDGATGYELDVATDNAFTLGNRVPVFFETFGQVEEETSIADHQAAGGFDNSQFTWNDGDAEQPADLRLTRPSAGYTNGLGYAASGAANVFFPQSGGSRGIGVGGIALNGRRDFFLSFGFRKEAAQAIADLTVEWSDNQGAIWHAWPMKEWPDGEAPGGWHLWEGDGAISVASDATASLQLRWRKNAGSGGLRIDDVLLAADDGRGSLLSGFHARLLAGTEQRVAGLRPQRYYFRVRALGANGIFSPYSNIGSVVLSSGTVVMFN